MKRSLIVIIALLSVGIMTAQSKNMLEKEFLNLDEQVVAISKKYDAKFIELDKKYIKEEKLAELDIDENELAKIEDEFNSFSKDITTKEIMELFVDSYEERQNNENNLDDENEEISEQDKAYLALANKLYNETSSIEKKMYEIAKKYLAKK